MHAAHPLLDEHRRVILLLELADAFADGILYLVLVTLVLLHVVLVSGSQCGVEGGEFVRRIFKKKYVDTVFNSNDITRASLGDLVELSPIPVFVDTMENHFEQRYSVWPERFFIIENGP